MPACPVRRLASRAKIPMSSPTPKALQTVQRHRAVIESIPSSKRGFVYEPATKLSVADREAVITSLNPTTDTVPSPSPAAQSFIDELPTDQQATVEARLKRIAAADNPTAFETVTATELAYGFSGETLTDSRLVSQAGVGVAHIALHGLLEEAGLDPKETLPASLTDAVFPDSSDAVRDSSNTDTDSLIDISELMDDHRPLADSLRHQLKYARDCFFIRQYHSELSDELSVKRVPKLVWKQAALDVQNNTDPFAAVNSDDDNSLSSDTGWLNQQYLPDDLKPEAATETQPNGSGETESDANQQTQAGSQAGLDQF